MLQFDVVRLRYSIELPFARPVGAGIDFDNTISTITPFEWRPGGIKHLLSFHKQWPLLSLVLNGPMSSASLRSLRHFLERERHVSMNTGFTITAGIFEMDEYAE